MRFSGREQVEIATLDGRASTIVTAANGYAVQGPQVAIVTLDPGKALGASAFGPVRYRVLQDGVASDWAPLVSLVRLPTLTGVTCDKGAPRCVLSGESLYLLAAVAGDAQFTGATILPDGFTAGSVTIPRPGDTLFLKLRDDDALTATAKPVVVDR